MTKQELLDAVNELPDDVIFLVCEDEEGYRFRPAKIGGVEYGQFNGYEWDVMNWGDAKEYHLGEEVERVVVL